MPLSSPRHSVHRLNAALQANVAAVEKAYLPKLIAAYHEVLAELANESALRLQRAAWGRPIVAAGDWTPPHPDEVYPDDAAGRLARASAELRREMIEAVIGGISVKAGVTLDVTNPLLQGVIESMGQHITAVAEGQRAAIMKIVQQAYDDGLSIPNAAAAIRADSAVSSTYRATMIARTELTAATNAGSLAAASVVNDGGGMLKSWLSAQDAFVREWHLEADEEYGADPIPVDQPFIVDGEEMMHPGDPNGSPGNVINCRCTTVYVQADEVASDTSSGPGYSPPGGQMVLRRVRLSHDGRAVYILVRRP